MHILRENIDALFSEGIQQRAFIHTRLFQLAIPEWQRVIVVAGWPRCGELLWLYALTNFIKFDATHHPNLAPGKMWEENGFIVDKKLNDWEVDISECKILQLAPIH